MSINIVFHSTLLPFYVILKITKDLVNIQEIHMKPHAKSETWYVNTLCLFLSSCLLAASLAAAAYLGSFKNLIPDWIDILISPSPLVTDYFQVGSLAAAFFNAGISGLACCLLMLLLRAETDVSTLAGFFLIIAHCFYGLNFLNMWPPMLGILLFCKVYKINFRDNLGMAMFSTAFGPFISELLFRYHVGNVFMNYTLHVDFLDLFYEIAFSTFLGFAIPAMLPGALKLHKGYNLYNGGLAFGLLGLFLYSFMYKTMGIEAPGPVSMIDPVYQAHGNSYAEFIIIFFLILFTILLLWGWYLNDKSFKGYWTLMKSTGHNADFIDEYGMPLVLINMGVYGYMILIYFALVIVFTNGAGFTGATTGVILAALTFTAKGQHPKNIWPILLGFVVLSLVVTGISAFAGREVPWTLSTQGYLNGVAFATGLCPIAGHYGKRYGVLAGFICAVICTSTGVMHGGFMLYNGGLAAGITALILIPCLDYYWKAPLKKEMK